MNDMSISCADFFDYITVKGSIHADQCGGASHLHYFADLGPLQYFVEDE